MNLMSEEKKHKGNPNWVKGVPQNPAGRPAAPKEVKIAKSYEFLRNIDKQRELDRIIKLTPAQLKAELDDPKTDNFRQILGRWTYMAITTKNPQVTKDYVEHVFGKPKEHVKVETDVNVNVQYQSVSVKEIREILASDPFIGGKNEKKWERNVDFRRLPETNERSPEPDQTSSEAGSGEECSTGSGEDSSGSEQT